MGEAISWEIVVSTVAHGLALGGVMLAGQCTHTGGPLFRPEDVMVVEMAGPALLDSRMPQRAERTPDAPAGQDSPTPPNPTPPDSMHLANPDAPKPAGDPAADRERLLEELQMQAALKNLNAPVGTTNRVATSPEGTTNPDGVTSNGVTDPELARWVKAARELVLPNWKPIRSYCVANPNLTATASVEVGADGSHPNPATIAKPSGNSSIDSSLLRAIDATSRLPAPPSRFAQGLTGMVQVKCKDIL